MVWLGKRTYSFVIFQTILVLIRFLTANDWAPERLWFLVGKESSGIRNTRQQLLLSDPSSNFTVRAILCSTELKVSIGGIDSASGTKQSFGWFVDTQVYHIIVVSGEPSKLRLTLHHRVLHSQVSETTKHAVIQFCRRPGGRGVWCGPEL